MSILGIRSSPKTPHDYSVWIDEVEQHSLQRFKISEPAEAPLLSIILVGTPALQFELIQDSIASVMNQIAHNWELLLVGDFISLDNPALQDNRVRIIPAAPSPILPGHRLSLSL